MTALLAASLFFTSPAPLDMPRAEAYVVKDSDGAQRLEDRYNVYDLWLSRAVVGRWMDDAFRVFVLATLDALPPALSNEGTKTRAEYEDERVPPDRRKPDQLFAMIDGLSPVPPDPAFTRPRQVPHGYKDVRYYQGTNTTTLVCAYLPEKQDHWSLATWQLADDDDSQKMREQFEREFLYKRAWEEVAPADGRDAPEAARGGKGKDRRRAPRSERELLRADARRSVAAYPAWHVTDAAEFTVLDDLAARGFVEALTNDLPVMRAKYAAAVPSPIDGSNTLCVARIYADRDEYLDALEVAGEELEWSAAYWSPRPRELVAYLPPQGEAELLKTIRHEAFHQYLSYACSMIPASPWFNEGYAQYFENDEADDWGVDVDLNKLEDVVPAVMQMDYRAFYDGDDLTRKIKYRLAWSLAYFIEKGAPKVRFEPFKDLKRDYVAYLLKTHDMRLATSGAFGSKEKLKHFIAEWKAFWRKKGL